MSAKARLKSGSPASAAQLERRGDLAGALAAYDAKLASRPDDPDLLAAVARLAVRMEAYEAAASLWARVGLLQPGHLEAVDGQARALRELGRFDEAVEVLRATLLIQQQEPRLWNALGVTLAQSGQAELAVTFYDEAVRLDPRFAGALYNRGNARLDLGDLEAAGADYAAARKQAHKPSDIARIDFATATLRLTAGDLAAGWDAYEVRFSRALPQPVDFRCPGRRWTPDTPLAGKRLLVVAEQGLGDEIMFANLILDVIEALGPEGRLGLAVEPRLAPLFRRSFPAATVGAHATERAGAVRRRSANGDIEGRPADHWAPMASLPRRFRRTVSDFPGTLGYLRPDPVQIERWRQWLGEGPPSVGLSWRSGNLLGDRRRNYPPLEAWAPVLRTPGVRFVNLQYGECGPELAALRELGGAEILEPPDLDLRNDIDGLAALCGALDLVLAVGNATAALAGACGHPTGLVAGPAAWPRLGTNGYPWYPAVRSLAAETFGVWEPVMAEAATMTAALGRTRASK